MQVDRAAFVKLLNELTPGLTAKAVLEQSDCFCFVGGFVYTFNDEISVSAKSPVDFDAVVKADDLLGVLSKVPDDAVDVHIKGGEMVIKGARRSAGISCEEEMRLPLDSVPKPGDWKVLGDGIWGTLVQAARTCGKDESMFLSTVVHAAKDKIEGCDGFRFFRFDGRTPFRQEALIPASNVLPLSKLGIQDVSVGEGWVHWRTKSGAVVSTRCGQGEYHKDVDDLLVMGKSESIRLPANLGGMVSRAELMTESGQGSMVLVDIGDGELVIQSRKVGGWYKERSRIKYSGRRLSFEVDPQFLVEILARTRSVEVSEQKMKIVDGDIQFVVSLSQPNPGEGEE